MLKVLNSIFRGIGEVCYGIGCVVTFTTPITRKSIEEYKEKYNLGPEPDESTYSVKDTRTMDPLQADMDALRKDWEQVGLHLREAINRVQKEVQNNESEAND